MVDAGKQIGLICSDTNMLMPQKSVTAIIGLSDNQNKCKETSKCVMCGAKNTCRFAKNQ